MSFVYNGSMKYFLILIALLFSSLIYGNWASASNIWEPLDIGFYSRIHDNIDSTVDILRKKELSKYATFAGFWWTCREKLAWLDREPMNESVLQNLIQGNLLPLSQIMWRNRQYGTSDTDSFANLVNCLSYTYRNMWDVATKDEKALTEMGILWLYSDGDTGNSDYDIVDDIEKINSILFTEELEWLGQVNTSRESFENLALWENIPSVSGWGGGWSSGWWEPEDTIENTPPESLSSLGIWEVCSVDNIPSTVSNIADDEFMSELGSVLAGWASPLWWANYGAAPAAPIIGETIASDVTDSLPCSDNFCIRVRMVPWTATLLGGGQNYSIESLIDKHVAIMEPISNSNLSAYRMNRNSYQDMTFQAIMKNWLSQLIFLDTNSPQQVKTTEADKTQEVFDKKFSEIQKCAYATAWLNSDIKRANILCGVGYQMDMTNTSENTVWRSEKNLCVIPPEDRELALGDCMSIWLSAPRAQYYKSFSTDIIELDAFNSAMIEMLSQAIESHKLLDKKKRF